MLLQHISFHIFFFLLFVSLVSSLYDGPLYDSTAYTQCKEHPEKALYDGGVLFHFNKGIAADDITSSSLFLYNLTHDTIYSFSAWLRIEGLDSVMIRARLETENETFNCIGTVLAKHGCWSFLKGGFVLSYPSNSSTIFFQNTDGKDVDNIDIASPSLQPFTKQQWRINQQYIINTKRKRAVTIHVSDTNGRKLQGASVYVEQISKEFPIGSAISKTILGNLPYQNWFVKRFNAAVFENELKWYATEPHEGKINYTISDQMMQFVRANKIIARGHNIFWEDPKYIPAWVLNLTGTQLQSAVNSRIRSLVNQYKTEFIHWDVSNEMLHFDFYEQRLGPNATFHFFEAAHESDPLATLFMNDFNVVETCSDVNSSVDAYISRIRELRQYGVFMDGIGLEGHFTKPNLPLIRAILDKLATLDLPIWLTEIDISNTLHQDTQAIYLEQVLREGFSHPSVNGIMLWTALHPHGCYQMCLTDNDLNNLPAGDVVDKLLEEWQTGHVEGVTDEHGSHSFYGFLGEYRINVDYHNRTTNSTFSLCRGEETRHVTVTL
ncbi:endo-1,4-beta-xylanase [Trifolium repens]|nr:endo-1,4-beta-xylanase [Trifolium repens]